MHQLAENIDLGINYIKMFPKDFFHYLWNGFCIENLTHHNGKIKTDEYERNMEKKIGIFMPEIKLTRLMLAYGQHYLGLCWGQIPPNWAFDQVLGLLPSFGASAQFQGLWPKVGDKHTHKQTNKLFVYILV